MSTLIRLAVAAALVVQLSGCGKDPEKAPSNREGYTDKGGEGAAAPQPEPAGPTAKPPAGEFVSELGFVVVADMVATKEAACQLSKEMRFARISNEIFMSEDNKLFCIVVGKNTTRERADKVKGQVVAAGFDKAQVMPAKKIKGQLTVCT